MLKYKIPQIVTLTHFFFIKINIKTVSTLVEIDNIKVVYKHIRKDGTKESFGFHKTKVSKDS